MQLLWIGAAQGELAVARACLDELDDVLVHELADAAAACDWLTEHECLPELIVVTQCRPGEISQARVDQLCRKAPLSRVVGLLGTWCEGESRSGRPWPGIERIYWHQWPSWLAREMGSRQPHAGNTWNLPPTANSEERLLAQLGEPRGQPCEVASQRSIAVFSHRRENVDMLSASCRCLGLRATCYDPVSVDFTGLSMVLWDSDRCGESEARELESIVEAVRPTPVAAMLALPRLEERQRALAAGAIRVHSKPLWPGELAWLTARF